MISGKDASVVKPAAFKKNEVNSDVVRVVVPYPLHISSHYGAAFYAFIPTHEADTACAKIINATGYTIKLVDFPVKINDIREGDETILRVRIGNDGCCGEKELMKLYIYNMTDYPMAVHLDLDTLLLNPL